MKGDGDANAWVDALIGANIQRYRTASGLSQAELAERLSERGEQVHQQTVQKIEKGTRPLRFSEGLRIAEILGVPFSAFAQPTPDTDGSVRIQRQTTSVANAARALDESVVKLAEELLRLAVVYARSAVPEEKPDEEITERARKMLELDWNDRLAATLLGNLGGEAGVATTKQALARAMERARNYDDDLGVLVEKALGVDE